MLPAVGEDGGVHVVKLHNVPNVRFEGVLKFVDDWLLPTYNTTPEELIHPSPTEVFALKLVEDVNLNVPKVIDPPTGMDTAFEAVYRFVAVTKLIEWLPAT